MRDKAASGRRPRPELSVVIPLFNEAATLIELYQRLKTVLLEIGRTHEILFVDDGSWDETGEMLDGIAARDASVRPSRLARTFGQTAALAAGFDGARGDVIVAMDGDLQHAPEDLPLLLDKLAEGYDVVSGWRERRIDNFWTRRLPSRAANWMMAKRSGVPLHDFGTTFKAYRRHVIKRIALHGDLHRFIPALCSAEGARIAEVPISNVHRPNNASHYGLSRAWRVMADLLTVRFLLRYGTRPLHLFGPMAFLSLMAGAFGGLYVIVEKILTGEDVFLAHGPLLLLSAMLVTAGVMLMAVGLNAEIMVRIYFDGRTRRIYRIARARPPQDRKLTPAA